MKNESKEFKDYSEPKKIKLLPEHIIDQIKAGEVIERPSLLIKELIENSLDAKATKIDITLVENGLNLISIEDNGVGMKFQDLPYAFLRHATSKLEKFEDIYALHSFGFRGEALASIAAISRLNCTTQPKNLDLFGGKIILNGGVEELLIEQKSTEPGTKIYIKDLFFNTPARLKFIKSKTSEKLAYKKIFQAFLLSNPNVEFSFKWDNEEKDIYKAKTKEEQTALASRVSQIFFNKKEKLDDLIEVNNEFENYSIKGFFSKSSTSGNAHKNQFLFVNQRLFFDKSLHQGIIRNLEKFWPMGTSGHYVFFLETPPNEIDVNIHPNKTQIKFLKLDVVYTLIMGGIKNSLFEINKNKNAYSTHHENPNLLNYIDIQEKKDYELSRYETSFQEHNDTSIDFFSSNHQSNAHNFIENELHSNLGFSSGHWFIEQDHNSLLFINKKKLIIFKIYQDLINWIQAKDHPSIPLLISEPMQNLGSYKRNDQKFLTYLEEIKDYGFEVDFLDHNFLVLRAVPAFLLPSSSLAYAEFMVSLYSLKKNSDILTSQFNLNDCMEKFYHSSIIEHFDYNEKNIFNEFSKVLLIENKIAYLKNANDLDSWLLNNQHEKR